MATLNELLARWATLGPPAEDGAAQFSIVAGRETTADALQALVEAAAPGHDPVVTPAFLGALAEETGGRFWILTFPDLDAQRGETLAFEVARALASELGLESCRPVLVDSLIGQAMVDPTVAGAAGLVGFFTCKGDNMGPEARGWAPWALGVKAAWDAHGKGAGVTIASIDTGYSDHVELQGVISAKPQLNLVENNANARDPFSTNVPFNNPGHGTLVASVAASRGDIDAEGNTTGPGEITGAAPEAEILPIRAIRSVVDLRQSRIPAAIEHAIAQNCDVIVMALGSPFPIEPVEVALRAAVRQGIVVVCAAGNCVGLVVFPARFAPLGLSTAVAAVDYLKAPWERTSKGDSVTVSAFGEAVWGARKRDQASPNNAVARSEGTTLATSLTAGVAALWVARHGGRAALKAHAAAAGTTVQAMFNRLIAASASKPSGGWPKGMGAGLVNAGELLSRPLPETAALLADVPLADDHVTPLKRFLGPTASEIDGLAGLEAAGLDEGLAAEALWRLYRGSARDRTAAIAGQDVIGAMGGVQLTRFNGPPPSPDLEAALAGKPRLRDLAR
ncbi:S8 family serine peptidase [Caulobacter sp. CCG-8]|uniref:S8 family peptidase n=1 Tax=Caulobacter sp. CCG-8 TaxID=3127958 RepID=UPI00307E69E6